jgi:hypothetical protein
MARLSVSLIARNEERNLARALASVVDVADEAIVTDTGSTDRTVEIARQFGAVVTHFTWIDDFAAARNHGNGLATGDWVFMLDADEELLPESRDTLADCLKREDVIAFTVARQDLQVADRTDLFSEMWQLRLFRNRPDLRMSGRIHEHFTDELLTIAKRERLTIAESNVRIRHYGYVASLRAEKNRRAAHLLELELTESPRDFYYLVELVRTLLALDDPRAQQYLLEAGRMVVDGGPRVGGGPLALLLELVLAHPHLPRDFPLSRAKAREIALATFPNAVPLLWHIAGEHNRRGEFSECAKLLERILSLAEAHTYDHLLSFNPAIMGDDARLNLGACYVRLGQLVKAKQCFRQLLESKSRAKEAAENLRAVEQLQRGLR